MCKSVLIVDDNDVYRESLIADMVGLGFLSEGCASGDAAIELVSRFPRRFQFVVVDQVLETGPDGIETTRKLNEIDSSLSILVFTHFPSDDHERIAAFRYQALAAGAFRYMERGPEQNAPKQIQDFVREMDQLSKLRDWLRDYYENRANVLPSLLTQLDIGVDVIDRSYKIWYMNREMRRIVGLEGEGLPKKPCSVWHERHCFSCPGCIVTDVLRGGSKKERYYLVPLPKRDRGRLFFTRVWAQPLSDASGNPLLGEDGKPLAVMESVQDLTDSAHWRQMPLNEKLDCVAKALYELPDPRKYLPTRCFDHVRIFVYDSGTRQFALNCAAGFSSHPVIGAPVDLSGSQRLKRAEDHMRNEQYGYYFPEDFPADVLSQPGKSERVIYWPIIADRVTIALLEAVGNQCDIDSVDLLRPYAKKIVEILENQQEDAPDTPTSEAADALAKIDLRLQTETDPSPRKALKLLVRECCTLTESVFPVLRYREQEDAVLVRLGLSQYDDHARFRFPLVEMTSWSARTILSGQMQIADTRHNRDAVLEMRNHMKSDARDFLNEIRSLCFLPLLLDGRCIGSLGLHSTSTVNFSAEKVDLARSIAGRVAFALHDYLVEHGIRREIEEAKEATIGLVLHNINTPLATLNNELEYLLGEVHADSADRGSLESGLGRIKAQSERIARIRSEYFKLHEPWTSRIEKVNPSEFLVRVSQECGKGMPVELRDERSRKTERVCLDKTGLRVCIEVLIGNGVDALLDAPAPRMVLTIREATAAESEMADSPDSILGIDVEDNGPGVPPQIQKGLFRIIKSAKSRGLGFGLSFCRYVAISAGGNVYFHSNYSNGARFTLLLPYKLIP